MGMKKPHLIDCEAICVHEEVAKRIPNVRFTALQWKKRGVYGRKKEKFAREKNFFGYSDL